MLAALLPVIAKDVLFQTQVEVFTPPGNYRVDFRLELAGVCVIECDGREFHTYARDRQRDLHLLKFGGITDIIHFKGTDVHFFPEKCAQYALSLIPYLSGRMLLSDEEKAIRVVSLKSADIQPIYRTLSENGHPIQYVPAGWKEAASSYRVCDAGDCFSLLAQDLEGGLPL